MTERFILHLGDCIEVLKTMKANSVDAVCCDPPYHLKSIVQRFGKTSTADDNKTGDRARKRKDGLARLSRGFMGHEWDGGDIAFRPATWRAIKRVLKPGGYLLAFGGTRSYHRMACAIEDAGFEVRDMLEWLYGSGMPKSKDMQKALVKAGLATPEEAAAFAGYGTALKPAHEPICMARKPLGAKTLVRNVALVGCGALNIDGCRLPDRERTLYGVKANAVSQPGNGRTHGAMARVAFDGAVDRHPANVLTDGSAAIVNALPQDMGLSVARFFYCAKASTEDREEGLHALTKATPATWGSMQGNRPHTADGYEYKPEDRANSHPTVKPTELMRWCVRLVTRKGGTVLDPFMGSGSTGKACMLEGMLFTGIDKTPEYVEIARKRIEWAASGGCIFVPEDTKDGVQEVLFA